MSSASEATTGRRGAACVSGECAALLSGRARGLSHRVLTQWWGYPSGARSRRHRRSDLQGPCGATPTAAHRQRQPPRTLALAHHRAQVYLRPPVAAQAVCEQLVLVLVQAGDAAEVDYAAERTRAADSGNEPSHHRNDGLLYMTRRSSKCRVRHAPVIVTVRLAGSLLATYDFNNEGGTYEHLPAGQC